MCVCTYVYEISQHKSQPYIHTLTTTLFSCLYISPYIHIITYITLITHIHVNHPNHPTPHHPHRAARILFRVNGKKGSGKDVLIGWAAQPIFDFSGNLDALVDVRLFPGTVDVRDVL